MRTEVQRKKVSRRKLTCIAVVLVSSGLIATCAPSANAQISNFAPPVKPGATVSVRQLQIPSKARTEFDRGVQRLLKRDPAGSLKHFNTAIQISPDYFEVYYHRGIAEMQLNRNDEALQSFEKAIDLSEGRYARAQFGYGLVLCRNGKPEEAERVVRKGLETEPNIADGHVVLGYALLRQNRVEEAEKSAKEALRLNDPNAGKGYLVLADIHAAKGDYQAQVQDLDTYLKLHPNDTKKDFLRTARNVAKRLASKLPAPRESRPQVTVTYRPLN